MEEDGLSNGCLHLNSVKEVRGSVRDLRGKSSCLNQITFPETVSIGICSWPHRKEERDPGMLARGRNSDKNWEVHQGAQTSAPHSVS